MAWVLAYSNSIDYHDADTIGDVTEPGQRWAIRFPSFSRGRRLYYGIVYQRTPGEVQGLPSAIALSAYQEPVWYNSTVIKIPDWITDGSVFFYNTLPGYTSVPVEGYRWEGS